jgi:phosphomannomutase
MARKLGVAYAETLTGFKWIANKAMSTPDKRFIFGYEEALGYTVGTVVRDKDGIGAGLVFAAMAAELHRDGQTLLGELDRIARRFGFYTSAQKSLRFPGAEGKAKMRALMAKLRSAAPEEIAGRRVVATTDVERGVRIEDGSETEIDLPKSNVLAFELEGGDRVIARPSGTEPKMKIYFDVRETMGDDDTLETVKKRALERCGALEKSILAHIEG